MLEDLNGYGRIIDYRAYNKDFAPENLKIERVKEGRFKKGKMDGYARKFSAMNGGTCFVGFFKEGKADGKHMIMDKDGKVLKQGMFNDTQQTKDIVLNNFTTKLLKTSDNYEEDLTEE